MRNDPRFHVPECVAASAPRVASRCLCPDGPRSNDERTYGLGILLDERTALATPEQFERLMDYSRSRPTGIYTGKRWRGACYGRGEDGRLVVTGWQLFEVTETHVVARELLVVE